MNSRSVGFIGGGRMTRILLGAWKRAGQWPDSVTVSDISKDVLESIKGQYPDVHTAGQENLKPAGCDVVFMALHIPQIGDALKEIKTALKPDAVLVSLAPKVTIARIREQTNGFRRVVRMIPNAPSVMNSGFNPVAFAEEFPASEKKELLKWFDAFGACPVVEEKKLEAYAVIAAMGPTYLWFQLRELESLAQSFGLSQQESKEAVLNMTMGAVKTLYQSGLSAEAIMDLIPVKPLADEETAIKNIYRSKLEALYQKLKG